ncbi:MAG TPA: hypothetical protein VME20_07115 [Acidimicrobiales bacterium]|nr:hypothetical protein [Acidimicrobiales bacterium]
MQRRLTKGRGALKRAPLGMVALLVAATTPSLAPSTRSASAAVTPLAYPAASPARSSPPTTLGVDAQVPAGSPSQLGEQLTGVGAHLRPPLEPSSQPYTSNCQQLVDPAFTGKCVLAATPEGTVAGIVELESAVNGKLQQERDLVWRRAGRRWQLADVHVTEVCLSATACGASPGLPALLWRDDLSRDGDAELVFVLPSDRAGFGSELDVVAGDGEVTLYRYLGGGFAVVPASGGLVTYVPGASEANPADAYFDQVFIQSVRGQWRLISDQYVPFTAALAQHRGSFYDPEAVPAS